MIGRLVVSPSGRGVVVSAVLVMGIAVYEVCGGWYVAGDLEVCDG
jgi:hypothetical protein